MEGAIETEQLTLASVTETPEDRRSDELWFGSFPCELTVRVVDASQGDVQKNVKDHNDHKNRQRNEGRKERRKERTNESMRFLVSIRTYCSHNAIAYGVIHIT